MRRASSATLLVFAVLTLTTAACDPSTDGIEVRSVSLGTVAEVVDVPASVTATGVATLTAADAGRIATLAVVPGTTVKKGAILAVIDSPAARKRLADATDALAAASSVSGISTADFSGTRHRVDQAAADAFTAARAAANKVADETLRAALLAQVDAAQAQYRAAARTATQLVAQVQAGVAEVSDAMVALGAAQRVQAQAAYDLAKSTVDALTLRAPIAGVTQIGGPAGGSPSTSSLDDLLGAVSGGTTTLTGPVSGTGSTSVAGVDDVLVVGDQVAAGTPIVTIVDVSRLGLVGEVDETDVLLVNAGVSATVELDAAPGARWTATVDSVDLLPTASSRGGVAYRIRLSLGEGTAADGGGPAPTPRPGMSAVAHLQVRTVTGAVAVPAAAVFTTAAGDTVWLIRDGTAVQQRVRVGLQGEELVEIVSGLEPGQRIVVSGADRVSAGEPLS